MKRRSKAREPKHRVGEDQTYKAETRRDKEGRNQDDTQDTNARQKERLRTQGTNARMIQGYKGQVEELRLNSRTQVDSQSLTLGQKIRLGGSQGQDEANANVLGTQEDRPRAQEEFARFRDEGNLGQIEQHQRLATWDQGQDDERRLTLEGREPTLGFRQEELGQENFTRFRKDRSQGLKEGSLGLDK